MRHQAHLWRTPTTEPASGSGSMVEKIRVPPDRRGAAPAGGSTHGLSFVAKAMSVVAGFRPGRRGWLARRLLDDRGVATQTRERVEMVEILTRLAGLHGNPAERTGTERRALARYHGAATIGRAAANRLIQVKANSAARMMCVNAAPRRPGIFYIMWRDIATAPFDRDLQLAVIDADGLHALVFPCRRTGGGWINARTGARLDVHPTHWRAWEEQAAGEGEVCGGTEVPAPSGDRSGRSPPAGPCRRAR